MHKRSKVARFLGSARRKFPKAYKEMQDYFLGENKPRRGATVEKKLAKLKDQLRSVD